MNVISWAPHTDKGAHTTFVGYQVAAVRMHRYRTARVQGLVVVKDQDATWKLCEELSKLAGEQPDNHVVFEVTDLKGNKLYYFCTDGRIEIGASVEVGNW